MFTRDGCFTIEGKAHTVWHVTSDGLVAIFNAGLKVWQYFRLNWKTERYDVVGSTPELYDPNLEAFDKSEVFVVN